MSNEVVINNTPYWLSFVSSVINSLSWPVAAVIIIFLLRTSIDKLVSKITKLNKLTAKGLELDFSEKIKEVKVDVDNQTESSGNSNNLINSELEYISEMALDFPVAAIIDSWKWLEKNLYEFVFNGQEFETTRKNLGSVLNNVKLQDSIPKSMLDTILEMRKLRNISVHSVAYSVTPSDASDYLYSVDKIIYYLKNSTDKNNH